MTDLSASKVGPNVLKNIFRLTERGGTEDRFTAAWGYVLDREPALAQAVADTLLVGRGLTAKVIGVGDHPAGYDSLDRPDFLIQCEEFDILVEHKLDALLGEKQLERYLQLAPERTWLALIAPAYQSVPAEVLIDPRYLTPEGKEHFRWSDFYEAVRSQPGRLAQEFADYMKSLGMAPFALKNDEDIFVRGGARPVQFEEALKLAADQVFVRNTPGCWTKSTPTGLGREVRAPGANLTLVYIIAEQRSACVRSRDDPVLAVYVYEADSAGKHLLENTTMLTPSGIPVQRHLLDTPPKQGTGTCRVTYAAPLTEIIQETREETVSRMVDILAAIRADFVDARS